MKKSALILVTLASAAVAGAGYVSAQAPAPASASQGMRVDNFQLADQTRFAHDLYYYKYAPAIVLMSHSANSPFSATAAAELQRIAASYKDKGVLFFMINSEPGVTREQVAAEAARQGLTIPILMDEYQLVGESLGISREGEVFVVDPKTWRVAYHGPLDNRFESASPLVRANNGPAKAYAVEGIEAVLNGKSAPNPLVALKAGKSLGFLDKAKQASFANISYEKQVAPILQEKCVNCHISGGIAPFAMTSYETVKGFAPMIRETVRTRRMPPYFPDRHIGHFQNDQGLTAEETKTLVHWIEAGAPRGAGPDPLKANEGKVAPDWPVRLGKPDVIIDLPAYTVPASGIVAYQNQRVPNPFKEDTWLRAISLKPGDRRVLHHVVSNHVPDPSRPRTIPGGSVGSYTPGAEPQVMAKDAGAPVPGGGMLNFQMHYTTFGKEATDRTQVGFYTLKTPPKYIKRSVVIGDFALHIPAGQERHEEVAYLTFPADAYLYTLYPHSHYRGWHVELKMKTPDGKEQMLLSLPRYDFNWQRDYDPVEPILVKAGTKLIAKWVYNNSPHNVANPDPKIDVTWGEQSHEEMMYFRVNYRWADETTDKLRNDLQQALSRTQTLGALDDNVDGLVQAAEFRGPMLALRSQFAQLDKDKNGGLDQAELDAAGNLRGQARGAARGGRGGQAGQGGASNLLPDVEVIDL